jgi:hypothetical protein
LSGPNTEQQLCAARLVLNLTISRADMEPGSQEEAALMSAPAVQAPITAPINAERWVLIDNTCQVQVHGESNSRIVHIFPTSTGEPGYETRNIQSASAFRYNPALENGGWWDSSAYPSAEDNPLNGNMYKPIYFDKGIAIHGSLNVPTDPRSKGCARLIVENQDQLIRWLGLQNQTEQTWNKQLINLVVTVQGKY